MDYHPIDQPDELTKREKEDAMGAYLMMFAAVGVGLPLPVINLIASVIYFVINKKKSRFVRFHSYQSLLSQLPTSVVNGVGVFWTLQIFLFENFVITDQFKGYILMAVLLNILYFVFSIVGAIQARAGKMYYFLFFGKMAYHHAYAKSGEIDEGVHVNHPPKL